MSGYAVKRLEDVPSVPRTDPGDPDWKPIQHHFRLAAFGMNAYVASEPGGILVVGGKPGEPFAGSTWRPEWFEHVPQL